MNDPKLVGNEQPATDQPTTEEALPGVDLGPGPGDEETAEETWGPPAAERVGATTADDDASPDDK